MNESAFPTRYGETDWDAQPQERAVFSQGIPQRPITGKSYEELRFGATEEKEAQKFVEINYNAVGVGSSTSFVNLQDLTQTTEVVVGKGEDQSRWVLHQQLLENSSDFAQALFKHSFKEKDENLIRLPEEKTLIFAEYVKFLYTGCIVCFSIDNLVQMYALGDRLRSTKFIDACYETLKKSEAHKASYSAEQIKYVFDNTIQGDKFRKLCVEQVGRGVLAGTYTFGGIHEKELLGEYMLELMEGVTTAVAQKSAEPAARRGLFDARPANPFGQPPSRPSGRLFGSQPAQPASGAFGTIQSTPQGGGLFGTTQSTPQGGGLFGTTQSTPQGGGLFGTTQSAPQGGRLFGTTSTHAAPRPGGLSESTNTSSAPSSASPFGTNNGTGSGSNALAAVRPGGLFGNANTSSAPPSGGLSGSDNNASTPAPGGLLGSNSTGGFGSANTAGLGSTKNGGFGSTSAAGTGSTNNGGSGSTSTAAFGRPSNGGFNFSNNEGFSFANNSSTTSAAGIGSTTNGGFGSTSTTAFGRPSHAAFGGTNNGGSSFGDSSSTTGPFTNPSARQANAPFASAFSGFFGQGPATASTWQTTPAFEPRPTSGTPSTIPPRYPSQNYNVKAEAVSNETAKQASSPSPNGKVKAEAGDSSIDPREGSDDTKPPSQQQRPTADSAEPPTVQNLSLADQPGAPAKIHFAKPLSPEAEEEGYTNMQAPTPGDEDPAKKVS